MCKNGGIRSVPRMFFNRRHLSKYVFAIPVVLAALACSISFLSTILRHGQQIKGRRHVGERTWLLVDATKCSPIGACFVCRIHTYVLQWPRIELKREHMSVCMYVCLYVCVYVCLSVCLSDFLYVCMSVWLSVCLYVCVSENHVRHWQTDFV